MKKRTLLLVFTIGVVLLVTGSAYAYYQYATPKKEKKIVLAAKVTPTSTIFPSSTPTATLSSTPTPIIKYIYNPTPTLALDFKQVLNDYEACKQACPVVGEGVTCTETSENNDQPQTPVCETIEGSEGGGKTVKCEMGSGGTTKRTTCTSNKHPDEACTNSCKSKYGLNF